MKQSKLKKMTVEEANNTNELIVVAIGASAGGLEALQEFFKSVPTDSGLAYVVIQHLSPDYKSMMDELLARQTSMKIFIIEDGMSIEANCVYLIPPRKNLLIFHDKLYLEDYNIKKGLNLPIDIFFRSLAIEKGKNCIGIILSGTGSDGALGTRAIKEAGGMVMVQNESTAKFDGMPRSSIATGLVDFILAPGEMPNALIEYVKHPLIRKNKSVDNILNNNYDSLTKIILILRDYCGIDFSYYKENTIIRRLERRVSINRFDSLEEYLILLSQSEKEKEILFRELLIGVTRFFRDTEAFNSLNENIIPQIANSNSKSIRIWSTGCSTGEEVYTLAMLFNEYFEKNNYECELRIFATDIDRHSLNIASQGIYPDNIAADVDAYFLNKYFNRIESGFQVKDNIRKMIVFATHNLLKDPPFSKLDMIICRNLFIYLKPDVQLKLLSMFYYSLVPGAYLFMGSSESVGDMSEAFTTIDSKNKIYKYKIGYKPTLSKEITNTYPKLNNLNTGMHTSKFMHTNKNERILEKIVHKYMPPSIIIDMNDNIIQIIGDINNFSTIQPGRFSQHLYSILPNDLGLFVSSFVRRIKREHSSIISEHIFNSKDFDIRSVKLLGHFIETDHSQYIIISFITNEDDHKDSSDKAIIVTDSFSERISGLEKELQLSKEALQATIEELETSNEELQSSNEELIASNEELQSTNEELQSVNEELYTVNSEYQLKIEELTRLNNDINNLIINTDIGAIYLDRNLCIRKITPAITRITTIINSDIGRPISHISAFNNTSIMNDIKIVAENLQTIENEYCDANNNYYYVKTRPYRTEYNAIDGILITFTDINSYKIADANEKITNKRLSDSLEIGGMAWWEWDYKSGEVIFDDKKATMLGYSPDEFPKNVYDICNLIHPDDYDFAMQAMRDLISGKSIFYEATYRIKNKYGNYSWYFDRGSITERDEHNNPSKIIGTVINVTKLKQLEKELEKSSHIFSIIFDNYPFAKTVLDSNGRIIYANKKAIDLFKLKKDEIFSRYYDSYNWMISDINMNPISSDKLPFNIIKQTLNPIKDFKHYINVDNQQILLSISGTAILSDENEFNGCEFTIIQEDN